MKTLLVTLIALLALSGCAWLEESPTTARAAVQYSTLKYIGSEPDRGQRVERTASEIRGYLSGESTVAALDSRLRSMIDWQPLDIADRILLAALLDELRDTMLTRIGDGRLSPDDTVRIERVIDWVVDAARLAQ